MDPIGKAQKTTRAMIADDMVSAEVDKKKAEADKAKAEAEEAKARARRAEAGTASSGLNIEGKFNIQELYAQREANLAALTAQAQEQAATQAGITENLREQLHAAQIDTLKTGFMAQMDIMTKMIEGTASKGTFIDQFEQAQQLATKLGYLEPGTGASDIQATLLIKKMEFEQIRESRRETREAKAEERRWQMALRKIDDEREARIEDQKRQAKKDEMIANAPAMIGGAIAKGLADRPETGISEAGTKRSVIEAGVGDSGTVKCGNCKQPVAIGPTARTADCAGCGAKYSIKRVASDSTSEAAAEEEE